MGISTRQVTVTTTPTILVDNTAEAEEVHLHAAGGQAVFLGDEIEGLQLIERYDAEYKPWFDTLIIPMYGSEQSL